MPDTSSKLCWGAQLNQRRAAVRSASARAPSRTRCQAWVQEQLLDVKEGLLAKLRVIVQWPLETRTIEREETIVTPKRSSR